MFNEVNGLPLHPLAAHAAVVLVPLAAFLSVLFAVPRTRSWSRLPLVLVSLSAVGAVFVARESGEPFREALAIGGDNAVANLVSQHVEAADRLFIFLLVYAALAIVAFVVSGRRSGSSDLNGRLALVMSVLLVLGGGGVAFQTYRVGELGARAVWGGVDVSGSSDDGASSGDGG